MGVDIIYALKGRQRRELAQAISEAMNTVPRYRGVPSCVYEIGGCVLDREGTLHIGDDVDAEAAKNVNANVILHNSGEENMHDSGEKSLWVSFK